MPSGLIKKIFEVYIFSAVERGDVQLTACVWLYAMPIRGRSGRNLKSRGRCGLLRFDYGVKEINSCRLYEQQG